MAIACLRCCFRTICQLHLVLPLMLVMTMTMMMPFECAADSSTSKCLLDSPDVSPRRHFYYNSTSLPITIETSNRPSHQLTSRVLRILLEEVLGYSNVKLIDGYNSMDTQEILRRLSGDNARIPETMVNLEIWVRSGFNLEALVSHNNLVNAGPLGPSGRFGWFMPKDFVDDCWNASRAAIDHWKALRLPSVTSLFTLSNQAQQLANLTARVVNTHGERSAPCDGDRGDRDHSDGCHGGVYYPPGSRCRHGNDTCAILVSSYPDLEGRLLEQQVTNLDMNVGIAYLGDDLNSFVEQQVSHETPVLFFNWIPNDLTATGSYTRVLFPMCQTSHRPPIDCDFEVHQLTKMVWGKIVSHTPEAYHLISRMELGQDEVNDLLVEYRRSSPGGSSSSEEGHDLERAACEWVRANVGRWRRWVPENLSSKTPIYLGGMFPITGPLWRQPGIVPGAMMAVEIINADDSILPDHELVLLIQDTQCKVDLAMTQFLQYVINRSHPIAGIVGPACAETVEPIAGVSKHFNTIVISYHAEAFRLTNRVQFPFFFRMRPHILQNGMVYVELLHHFGWEQVALLAEDGQGYPEYHAFLKDLFLSKSIQVVYDRKIPRKSKVEDAAKYVDELKKKDVRIIILTSFEQAAGAVLCEAFRKGLTAADGYVWFVPSWFTYNWWLNSYYKFPCSAEEMKAAVQGHFYLDTAYLGHQNTHIVGNFTVRQWQQEYQRRMSLLRMSSSGYASYAYDTVLVFALGLHQLLKEDPSSLESLHTDKTVDRFMYYLNHTHFSGASGPVQFVGADRTGIINIHQHTSNSSTLVGQFVLDNGNMTDRLSINNTKVVWFTRDGRQPTDGHLLPKKCSIEGFRLLLGVECDSAIVIANVIGISIFVVIMLICLVALKKWYDHQVDQMKQKMDPYHLLEKLDRWQVPRDKVVLNRKIGEGTSGTVYGGEANINGSWVAVAVKTLKTGASLEEKLDFLSEAEMMKEFDHRNVVKLLGVCTAGDPIYMIMEFMLHGDLKTFLLARRQMVGQTTSEAEDVSSRGLTKMALNVANGLKYLSSLNYVHRDLACRNCLVNSDKTVLIGDFGMTKCMFDKDYYQFNQKGKFPVRWMAPESLRDGLFTTASDIWSFGVLLYEIMTLGSFPYQGHCNKDVLELVKNGKRIEIPQMCSAKVRSLLLSCWEFNPENRPTIDSIIELLEHHPELIEPCLDGPSSAIALDLTSSLEANILPNFKTRSTRLRLSSDNTLHLGTFSMSSQDIGINDEFSPDPILIDPFCSAKRPSIPIDESVRKSSDVNRRSYRFSLDSFRRSLKLGLSVSSDEPMSDDRLSATSELQQNGFCGDSEKKQQASPYIAGNYATTGTVSKKRLSALLRPNGDGGCEDEMLMSVPPSVESKADSDYYSQNSKHLTNAESLPFV